MNEPTTTRNTVQPHIALTIIIASIAANVVLGTIVRHATLPVYLDTVGTISMAILLRWRWALLGTLLRQRREIAALRRKVPAEPPPPPLAGF